MQKIVFNGHYPMYFTAVAGYWTGDGAAYQQYRWSKVGATTCRR